MSTAKKVLIVDDEPKILEVVNRHTYKKPASKTDPKKPKYILVVHGIGYRFGGEYNSIQLETKAFFALIM